MPLLSVPAGQIVQLERSRVRNPAVRSHGVQVDEPNGAYSPSAHGAHPPCRAADPGGQRTHVELSGAGTSGETHGVHSVEPGGAASPGAQRRHVAPTRRHPASQRSQRVRSSDGRSPSPHSMHSVAPAANCTWRPPPTSGSPQKVQAARLNAALA